jgi:hypothetical protein
VIRCGGFILRDARKRAPQDEVFQTLMVRSAATPRVSNHQADVGIALAYFPGGTI